MGKNGLVCLQLTLIKKNETSVQFLKLIRFYHVLIESIELKEDLIG